MAPGDPQVNVDGSHSVEGQQITLVCPLSGWQLVDLSELWRYRELLFYLIWRDVKVRYKQTALGASWAILQPLVMMILLTIVFGIMGGVPTPADLPKPIFYFSGMLLWQFFATAINTAGNSVVQSTTLVTKVYFPRLAIPFASVGAAAVDFTIAFGVLVLMMFGYRIVPGWGIVLVPVLLILAMLAALGVGTFLAALNVSYRDFRHTLPFLVQLWMLATPTIYMDIHELRTVGPESIVSSTSSEESGRGESAESADSRRKTLKRLARYLEINPMTGLIASFRAAILGQPIPWSSLGFASVVIVIMFVVGCVYFRRVEGAFADLI